MMPASVSGTADLVPRGCDAMALFYFLIFVICICEIAIADVIVFGVCAIFGLPFSLWIGAVLWILYIVTKYTIKIHIGKS